jgi:hypothetical protein
MFAVRAIFFLSLCACAHADDKKPDAPKTFEMKFKAAKWEDVFAWYAKETGAGFIPGKVKPKGALTLKFGAGKRFTVGEVTDLLNEALAQQGFIVLRGEKSFLVVNTKEKIDVSLVPFVSLSDLKNRGSTELVRVSLKPTDTVLANLDEVKKLLTSFGALERTKDSVILTDTAGNVQRFVRVLDVLGAP